VPPFVYVGDYKYRCGDGKHPTPVSQVQWNGMQCLLKEGDVDRAYLKADGGCPGEQQPWIGKEADYRKRFTKRAKIKHIGLF